jgi:hypothetical protein
MGADHGEPRVCSTVPIPDPVDEDARRFVRERQVLLGERIALTNRIDAVLATLGIRGYDPRRRDRRVQPASTGATEIEIVGAVAGHKRLRTGMCGSGEQVGASPGHPQRTQFFGHHHPFISRRISPSVSPACRNARRFQTVAVLGDGYSREPRITVRPGRLAAMSSAATPEWGGERRSEPLGRSIPVCPVVRYDVGAPGAVPLRSVSLRPSPAVYRHAQVG